VCHDEQVGRPSHVTGVGRLRLHQCFYILRGWPLLLFDTMKANITSSLPVAMVVVKEMGISMVQEHEKETVQVVEHNLPIH
jgi:hypothetical protein